MKMQELQGQAFVTETRTETAPPLQSGEVRFFTSPKAVTKKTQLSITVFQLITTAAICLLLKLCDLLSPQLFANLSRYLEHLFLW